MAKIETIGIIGAGQMGGGIAHVSALSGFKVLIYDISPDRIEKGIATISGNIAVNILIVFISCTPVRRLEIVRRFETAKELLARSLI